MAQPSGRAAPALEGTAAAAQPPSPAPAQESKNERAALRILKRLAGEAGMRERGEDGHRAKPSLAEMEERLVILVQRGRRAAQSPPVR